MSEHLFPSLPYDDVGSAFTREEIRTGSFADLDHRQYVNRLAWVEWFTRFDPGSMGTAVRHWKIAAEIPEAYDIVRRELGAPPRPTTPPVVNSSTGTDEREERERRHAAEWRRVQEGR